MLMFVGSLVMNPCSPEAFSRQNVHPESTTVVDMFTSSYASCASIAQLCIAARFSPPFPAPSENMAECPGDTVIGETLRGASCRLEEERSMSVGSVDRRGGMLVNERSTKF